MFHLIRLIIWIAGIVTIAYFTLPYFGYELNASYFKGAQAECRKQLDECQKTFISKGVDGAKEQCLSQFHCVDPSLFIKKK
jgi:hypothetical protein